MGWQDSFFFGRANDKLVYISQTDINFSLLVEQIISH